MEYITVGLLVGIWFWLCWTYGLLVKIAAALGVPESGSTQHAHAAKTEISCATCIHDNNKTYPGPCTGCMGEGRTWANYKPVSAA